MIALPDSYWPRYTKPMFNRTARSRHSQHIPHHPSHVGILAMVISPPTEARWDIGIIGLVVHLNKASTTGLEYSSALESALGADGNDALKQKETE